MEIEVGLLRLQSFRNLRDIGLQFCFVIQINLCNLTTIQEDCSRIAEIAKVPQLTYTCPNPPQGACMFQSSQVTRVPEVFWLQILISACLLQSYKLPELQKFYGRRY